MQKVLFKCPASSCFPAYFLLKRQAAQEVWHPASPKHHIKASKIYTGTEISDSTWFSYCKTKYDNQNRLTEMGCNISVGQNRTEILQIKDR